MKNLRIPFASTLKTSWTKVFGSRRQLKKQLNEAVEANLLEECLTEIQSELQKEIDKKKRLDTRRQAVEKKGKWVDSIYLKLQEGKKLTTEEQNKLKRYKQLIR